ncbi:MAG: anhydro-N-acetylmuramic acid kinase [Pseudomonadota bacterium]
MTQLTAIGLMSDRSLSGVHAALVVTDGESVIERGPAIHAPYSRDMKIWLRRAMAAAREARDGAADIGKAAGEVTYAHAAAVEQLLEEAGVKRTDVDVLGFHGATILHEPRLGAESYARSWQVGDAAVLAEETGIDVVSDFRAADIAAGGDGAPLAPVYYRALVSGDAGPTAVLSVNETVRFTYVPAPSGCEAGGLQSPALLSFEACPGLAMMEEWSAIKTGSLVKRAKPGPGAVAEDRMRMMLLAPYLRRRPPKTIAPLDFKLDHLIGLEPEDGAATLAAFIANAVNDAQKFLPEAPAAWIVCGRGRDHDRLMPALCDVLDAPLTTGEEAGWPGDALEAECFGFLAVRSLRKRALSFPTTTRVRMPTLGGVYHRAPK